MLNRSRSVIVHRRAKESDGDASDGGTRRLTRRALFHPRSGWPLNLAAGALGRPRGLLAGDGAAHREHVVGIALSRMRFADEYGAHELVVAGAVFGLAGLHPNLGR